MSEPIGARLTRLREARGLTPAAVAMALRCDPKVIEALEAERWAELGAPVFSRGHLRRYAEHLDVPAEPLLAQWTAEQGALQTLPDLSRAPQAPRPLDTQRWARRLAMLAGAVVIALAAWWILQGADVRPPMSAPPPEAPAVATPVPSAPADAEEAAPPDTALSAGAPEIVAAAAVAPATEAAAGSGLAVVFTATERCWAEVVDVSGARRLYTMLEPGARVTARGMPPLRVVLGRADVTAVEIAGRVASIPPDALRSTVARFEIDGSGAMRALPPEPVPTAPAPAADVPAAGAPAADPPVAPQGEPAPGAVP
jgi:cytoskeleton protein RodZ